MTLAQAMLNVGAKLPSLPQIRQRLNRAYDIVRSDGSGYSLHKIRNGADPGYIVFKASTSLLEDNSVSYQVTKQSCTCPDYPGAPSNLCKHRLAILLVEEMAKAK